MHIFGKFVYNRLLDEIDTHAVEDGYLLFSSFISLIICSFIQVKKNKIGSKDLIVSPDSSIGWIIPSSSIYDLSDSMDSGLWEIGIRSSRWSIMCRALVESPAISDRR